MNDDARPAAGNDPPAGGSDLPEVVEHTDDGLGEIAALMPEVDSAGHIIGEDLADPEHRQLAPNPLDLDDDGNERTPAAEQ